MANREKVLRDAYFSLLDNNVTYNSIAVPISDLKLENPIASNVYILFGAQSSTFNPTFAYDAWDCSFTIQIVCKQTNSVSRDILDELADQIESLIVDQFPAVLDSTYQVTNNYLNHTDYMRFEPTATSSPIVKNLEFHQLMIKL